MVTGGGDNHNYGVLPPLFHDISEYFHSMKGGAITSSDNMAVPMTLLSTKPHRDKKKDYQEITHDQVVNDELYENLLQLLQVKNNKKTSRKKRKTISTEVKKQNSTRKNI